MSLAFVGVNSLVQSFETAPADSGSCEETRRYLLVEFSVSLARFLLVVEGLEQACDAAVVSSSLNTRRSLRCWHAA